MPQNFHLLVDDQDGQINYLCPSLKQRVVGSYSNNTWTTIQSESCKDGWFEYTFYGTGIRVEIPTAQPSQDVSVTLDDTPYTPQPDGTFESPVLADGKHTLKYTMGNVRQTPVFDYLTVTAGPSTPLNGRTLIVDDTDSALTYKGSWSTNPPRPLNYGYSTSLYLDSAHWSSTPGDTIEFEFTGTSVSVFGLASNFTRSHNITAAYTIDGVTQTLGIPTGAFDSVPMTEFFHADLAAGRHTLVINLTDIATPRAFGIDFIAYNTSVDSVTSLPGYEAPASNASPYASGEAKPNNALRWAIVGGVLGAVLFLLLLGLTFFFVRSRLKKKAASGPVMASQNSSYDDIEAIKHGMQTRQ